MEKQAPYSILSFLLQPQLLKENKLLSPYLLTPKQLHGNLIFYKNKGLIFVGPSGAGKSMLSFKLIQKKAQLIADDIIRLHTKADRIYGQCPDAGFGHMEIFGLGIIKLPSHHIKKTAPIDHIFIHHNHPPRQWEEQKLYLLDRPIKTSFLNFNHHFACDYIDAFCDYRHKIFS